MEVQINFCKLIDCCFSLFQTSKDMKTNSRQLTYFWLKLLLVFSYLPQVLADEDKYVVETDNIWILLGAIMMLTDHVEFFAFIWVIHDWYINAMYGPLRLSFWNNPKFIYFLILCLKSRYQGGLTYNEFFYFGIVAYNMSIVWLIPTLDYYLPKLYWLGYIFFIHVHLMLWVT